MKRFDLLIAGPGSKNKKFETVVTPYDGQGPLQDARVSVDFIKQVVSELS